MLNERLNGYLSKITAPDRAAADKAQKRLDSLVKPRGSLGRLEDIAIALAGIGGKTIYDVGKRCVIIMSSDNGVVDEGVASAPQSVTYTQTLNFTKGITGVAVLAKQFGADLIVVDVGINADISHPLVRNMKLGKSTRNIAKQAAMTHDEAVGAILVGIETAERAVRDGYRLLGVGEMGIGNTTTASAVLCALTGIAPEQAVGKGAGLNDAAYANKISVVYTALDVNKPDPANPLDALAKLGGYDIAAMTGVYIGAAVMKVPVVIDGFISIVAALLAARLNPITKGYMLASHGSAERGYALAARELGVRPCLLMDMRLGEGSGCPLMFSIIDAACAVIRDMGTFEQANIATDFMNEITHDDSYRYMVNEQ